MERVKIEIEKGALKDAPVYCSHKRGKNWLARIEKDPRSPGGFKREFAPRAYGEFYYILPESWKVGDEVEFGADYYTNSGKRHPKRWIGKIVEIGENYIIFEGKER